MRVVPDVAGIAALGKSFDYRVPAALDAAVTVGTMVRIDLHGRRVGGWVVADRDQPLEESARGVALRPLARVSGLGPDATVVDLTEWAAWRWAGRRTAFLRAASPDRAVRGLPSPARATSPAVATVTSADMERLAREALSATQAVVRLPPSADSFPLIVAATQRGPTLAIVPQASDAALLVRRLRRGGIAAALLPGEWAVAAAGTAVAVGPRSAAWATVPHLGAAVVVDAHDELLVAESTPTWSAWVVAAERARRAGVPCVLISPCPTLEQLRWGRLVTPARTVERAGWARIAVIDRRREDPRTGMISSRLVDALRRATPEQRVVCVLNRKGRARLLACGACYALVRCERCGAALSQFDDALQCAACGLRRPIVCAQCGATRLRALRPGVSRLRDDLEALAQRPAAEVTAETAALPGAAILVGTEAVLHRLIPTQVASVALLDFDASLLAPHHRAAEEAMALLVRCARLAGRRDSDGEVIVQTRLPDHPVLVAAVRADPDRASVADARVRGELGLPPYSAAAIVSGAGAQAYVEGLRQHPGVRVDGPLGDRWFARAPDHHVLCDALSAAERPSARVRIEVDPRRL